MALTIDQIAKIQAGPEWRDIIRRYASRDENIRRIYEKLLKREREEGKVISMAKGGKGTKKGGKGSKKGC